MDNATHLGENNTSTLKNIVAKSIEGQPPTWKNALSRRFADISIEDVMMDIESESQFERPPAWFENLVNKIVDLWFDPKSFENVELYEKLGIKTYKKYIPTGEVMAKLVWRFSRRNAFINSSTGQDLKIYEKFTRIYETIHLPILPIAAANIGMCLSRGELGPAAFSTVLNVLVNVYPVLLQRYNRLRLYKTIELAQERDNKRNHDVVNSI